MRKPDFIIGSENDPQTKRWDLFKWRGIQFALHRWLRSDSDRALHDHSADNVSILFGFYWEWFSHSWEKRHRRLRLPLLPYFRRAETPHRVQLIHGPMWTLWIRFPKRREWGFHCRKGWVHWKEYVTNRDENSVTISGMGSGCG